MSREVRVGGVLSSTGKSRGGTSAKRHYARITCALESLTDSASTNQYTFSVQGGDDIDPL